MLNKFKLIVIGDFEYFYKVKINNNVERNNKTIQEEFFLPNYTNLKTNISYLKIFAKQIQNLYNFIRFHKNLKFNNRLFEPVKKSV